MNVYTWWLILATISLYVIYQDITKRTISNKVVLLVMCLCLFLFIEHGEIQQLYNVVGIVFIGFILSILRIIAAGDVKLLAAFSLAISAQYFPLTMFLITLLGSLLGGGYYLYAKFTDYEKVMKNGVPYGVPICIGCLFGIAASL